MYNWYINMYSWTITLKPHLKNLLNQKKSIVYTITFCIINILLYLAHIP